MKKFSDIILKKNIQKEDIIRKEILQSLVDDISDKIWKKAGIKKYIVKSYKYDFDEKFDILSHVLVLTKYDGNMTEVFGFEYIKKYLIYISL